MGLNDADFERQLEASLATPPQLAPLGVDYAPVQWLGFPWWASLTFAALSADDALLDLGLPDEYASNGLLGLRLARAHAQELILDRRPAPHHGEHAHYRRFDLDYGECRTVLVDLSHLLTGVNLWPDDYVVAVEYDGGVSASHKSVSTPLGVRMQSVDYAGASARALRQRAEMAQAVEERGSWLAVFEDLAQRGGAAKYLEGPSPGGQPLAWPALRALARDPAALQQLAPTVFEGYPTAVEPFAKLLFIQWLLAKNQREQARSVGFDLRARSPGLAKSVDALGLGLPPQDGAP